MQKRMDGGIRNQIPTATGICIYASRFEYSRMSISNTIPDREPKGVVRTRGRWLGARPARNLHSAMIILTYPRTSVGASPPPATSQHFPAFPHPRHRRATRHAPRSPALITTDHHDRHSDHSCAERRAESDRFIPVLRRWRLSPYVRISYECEHNSELGTRAGGSRSLTVET